MNAEERSWDRFVKSNPRRAAQHCVGYPPATKLAVLAALARAGRCRLCGRLLRDEASKLLGVGPECLKKERAA